MKKLSIIAIIILFLITSCAPVLAGEKEDLAFRIVVNSNSIKERVDEINRLQKKYHIDQMIKEMNELKKQIEIDNARFKELENKEKAKKNKKK